MTAQDEHHAVTPPRQDRHVEWGDEQFSTEVEHIFDAVFVISAGGTVLMVSSPTDELLGYDLSAAVGLDIFDLVDGADAEALRTSFDDLVAYRKVTASMELRAVGPDGDWIDVEIVASNHIADEIGGIVVNVRDITERKKLARYIEEAERRHSQIIDSLVDGVMMVDSSGTIVRVNDAFEAMFHVRGADIVGRKLLEVLEMSTLAGGDTVGPDNRSIPGRRHPLIMSLATGERYEGVIHGITRVDGPTVWIRINSQAIFEGDAERPVGAVASFSDISEGRVATTELRLEQKFVNILLGNLEEGIVACDAEGRITIFNPAAMRLHGLSERADPIGKVPSARGLLHVDGTPMSADENPLVRALSGERLRDVHMLIESKEGGRQRVSVNGQTLFDDLGGKLGAVVAMHDVTEQKRNEERLAELALHDPLTALANRTLLAERLKEAVEGLAETGPATTEDRPGSTDEDPDELPGVAVFLLDLDNFKEVNDELGHDVGDDVLLAVSRRLLAIVRPSDTVARLGGDEFVVVCRVKHGAEEMEGISARISTTLAEPYRIDGRTMTVLASVGGVLVHDATADPSKLLSQADDAMYQVKWGRRRERRSMID